MVRRCTAGLAVVTGVLFVCGACRAAREPSRQIPAADAAILQSLKGGPSILTWQGAQQRVGYAHLDRIARGNTIPRGGAVYPLPASARDFSTFRYSYKGVARTVDDFIRDMNAVGILLIVDGRIVLERYAHGHTADTRWTSFSVAKSVMSLLFGAAMKDGHIGSLDDSAAKYLRELEGTSYDPVTLRHLLQMSSGMAWNGDMSDPKSDVAQLPRLNREGDFSAQLAYMIKRPRVSPPGRVFNYNTADADLAAAVLRAATGRTLSDYLSQKIWRPVGMQADGFWLTIGGSDLERGGCCISATLRDYGRIGLFAMENGRTRDGAQVLPEGWIAESTRPSPSSKGYGYYWWLGRDGRYFASGSFGQHIEVAPAQRAVVAIQSFWPAAFNKELIDHNDTFVDALLAGVGGAVK